jgi:hypothetical protein
MTDAEYKIEYMKIGMAVEDAFPTCEVSVTDMVRLIVHENLTLRLALGLPTYNSVQESLKY